MEGLHTRRKAKTYPEDELEYLDEVEQETLLQDLRNQNDAANQNILKGLLVINCLTSLLYISLLAQSSRKPMIPIANIVITVYGSIGVFRTAAISSILSTSFSFFMLAIKSKIDLFGINKLLSIEPQHAFFIGVGSLVLGIVGPMTCLFYNVSLVELIFWSIPLIISGIYYIAYYMMKQVQQDLDELERSKYKYKAA